MIDLLKKKLDAVSYLKAYTKEILLLSAKTDDEKISIMIDERQKYIEDINIINIEIDKYLKSNEDKYFETNEIKTIKNNLKESFNELINMDKEIRKGLNDELRDVKVKLSQPETASKLVNIKI